MDTMIYECNTIADEIEDFQQRCVDAGFNKSPCGIAMKRAETLRAIARFLNRIAPFSPAIRKLLEGKSGGSSRGAR